MATITPSAAGSPVTYQAAVGGGDQFKNSGRERLHVRNGGGSPITVTIVAQKACNQGVVHTTTTQFTVTNGSDYLAPAYNPDIYNDGSGYVQVSYSGVTSVTVGVIA